MIRIALSSQADKITIFDCTKCRFGMNCSPKLDWWCDIDWKRI